jgi:hypothetical protein
MDELRVIFDEIQPLIAAYQPPMVVVSNDESHYELRTNKPVEILGRKKPYLAFASLIIQSSYVGFYFMPVYTDTDIKEVFHADLLKLLKGKSCFHIKKTSPDLLNHIRSALKIGFEKYQTNGWV